MRFYHTFDNVFLLGFEIFSSGPAGEYWGYTMGRYEPIIGEEQDGFPVYKQAHSREIPTEHNYLLFR